MCLHGTLCSIPLNYICDMTTFSKKMFDLLILPKGTALCACEVLKLHSHLVDMQHDYFQKKILTFYQGSGVCIRTEYMLACCCIRRSLYFDTQQDHVLKKLNFELSDPTPQGWGRRGVGVDRQYISYHVAACVIPFNLICNMTIF